MAAFDILFHPGYQENSPFPGIVRRLAAFELAGMQGYRQGTVSQGRSPVQKLVNRVVDMHVLGVVQGMHVEIEFKGLGKVHIRPKNSLQIYFISLVLPIT